MGNSDSRPAIAIGQAENNLTISPSESLIPYLRGENKDHVTPELSQGAVEIRGRNFRGPFPTADFAVRAKIQAQLQPLSAEDAVRLIKGKKQEHRVGSFFIGCYDQTVLASIEAQTGGTITSSMPKDKPGVASRVLLSPNDPLLELIGQMGEALLPGEQLDILQAGGGTKQFSGNTIADIVELVRHHTDITNDDASYYFFIPDGISPPPNELFRPQLGKWILQRINDITLQSEVIGGGMAPSSMTINRIASFAARAIQSSRILHDTLTAKLNAKMNPGEIQKQFQAYAEGTWSILKPQIRQLIISQGFDPASYHPLDWKIPHPETGAIVPLREIIDDIRELAEGADDTDQRWLQLYLNRIDSADQRLKDYFASADVRPTTGEKSESRAIVAIATSNALAAISQSGGSALAKVQLPLSKLDFSPFAAERLIDQIMNIDFSVFDEDVWTNRIMKDGKHNAAEQKRLAGEAKKILQGIGIHVDAEYKETDQEVMLQATRQMLEIFDQDTPPIRKAKQKAAARLDMAYSVYLVDISEKLTGKK